jgi:hypothetical protein
MVGYADMQTHRQQGDFISSHLFFQNKKTWLKMDQRNMMECYCLDPSDSGQGPVEGSCEHGNETSGSINLWTILQQLSDWYHFR